MIIVHFEYSLWRCVFLYAVNKKEDILNVYVYVYIRTRTHTYIFGEYIIFCTNFMLSKIYAVQSTIGAVDSFFSKKLVQEIIFILYYIYNMYIIYIYNIYTYIYVYKHTYKEWKIIFIRWKKKHRVLWVLLFLQKQHSS